jgi:hypothetical protein
MNRILYNKELHWLYRSSSRGRIGRSGRLQSHLAAGMGRLRNKFRMMVKKPAGRPMIRE